MVWRSANGRFRKLSTSHDWIARYHDQLPWNVTIQHNTMSAIDYLLRALSSSLTNFARTKTNMNSVKIKFVQDQPKITFSPEIL